MKHVHSAKENMRRLKHALGDTQQSQGLHEEAAFPTSLMSWRWFLGHLYGASYVKNIACTLETRHKTIPKRSEE